MKIHRLKIKVSHSLITISVNSSTFAGKIKIFQLLKAFIDYEELLRDTPFSLSNILLPCRIRFQGYADCCHVSL